MPWKECHVEDERLRFVARLLEGQAMSALCAEFVKSEDRGNRSSSLLVRQLPLEWRPDHQSRAGQASRLAR